MNHCYRTVFNRALGVLQITSELTRGNGKCGSRPKRRLVAGALLSSLAGAAQAVDISTLYTNEPGALNYISPDHITQSSALVVSGASSLTAPGDIILLNSSNDFGGPVSVDGNSIYLRDSNSLNIAALNNAAGGDISLLAGGMLTLGQPLTTTGNITLESGGNTLNLNHALRGNQITLSAPTMTLNSLIVTSSGLTFNSPGGLVTVNNLISGAGGLTLNTNITAIFFANSYQGGTTLNSGSLLVGNDQALGTGALTTTNNTSLQANVATTLANDIHLNGSLTVSGSYNLGLSGLVDGTGSLSKSGSGNLTLSHANNYSGGTQLSAGTLTLGNGNALGTGTLTVLGASTLANNGNYTLANDVQLSSGLTISGTHDLTLNGVISGVGSLIKQGQANLTLSGPNNYANGTTLSGGTLTLGNDDALGSGALSVTADATLDTNSALELDNAISIANGAELTLTGDQNLSLHGVLSGSGALTKNGSYDLRLTGTNTYSGQLNIANGSLTLAGNNVLSDADLAIANGAIVYVGGNNGIDALSGSGNLSLGVGYTLAVGTGDSSSLFGGDLTGDASLDKQGSGTLVLNGNSILRQGTFVNGGSLIIGGSAGSTASLESAVNVASGALLGGHGRIIGDVDIASGATLAPGNSIGTLSVTGNVTLASGSLFEVEANPDGSADSLTATGDVSLNGATLSLLAGNGSWAPNTSYSIISASNVIGTFATPVVSNLAFLDTSLDYSSGNSVVLSLTRNDISFANVASTDNQRASAAGIESLATSSALYNAIAGLSASGARAAYDNLSGEIHASLQSALLDDSRYVRESLNQRLLAAQGLTGSNGVLRTSTDGPTFWLQGYGGWARNDSDNNAARLEHDSQGTLFGADVALNDTWRVGAAVGLGRSDIDAHARDSSADVDSQSLALYASGQWQRLNLRLGAARSWNQIDTRRHVQVGALNEREKASYDATTTQLFSELGYRIDLAPAQLEPFIGLAHVQFDGDAVDEHGGNTALHGQGQEQEVSYSSLGLRGALPLATVADVPVSAQGSLAWQHAFGDTTPDSRLAFAGGDSFQVQGTPMERNSAVAELGLQAQVTAATRVGLSYSGRFGEDYRDNGVRLALSVGF